MTTKTQPERIKFSSLEAKSPRERRIEAERIEAQAEILRQRLTAPLTEADLAAYSSALAQRD